MTEDILLKDPFRVLVVEDDRIHFHFEKTILDKVFGDRMDVTWAESADKASDLLLREQFDICLMDYLLGDTDAKELMLDVDAEHLDTPVIIVSAFDEEDFDVNILQYGAEDYLVKGRFDAKALENSIRHAIYRKSKTKFLRSGALRDPLTGLANRMLFDDRLKKVEQSARRDKAMFALLFIDINGLKEVNNRHGYQAGDELIKHVGGCFKRALRESDTVARCGGGEFLGIASGISNKEDAQLIAAKILNEVSNPLVVDGVKIMPSVSMGISYYPDSTDDLSKLVRKADYAMYEAKKKGGGLFGI